MELINFFGLKLAALIGQNGAAGIGLLCLALKDAGLSHTQLNYHRLKITFEKYLPPRLEKAGLTDPEGVAIQMVSLLKESQSLVTLASH